MVWTSVVSTAVASRMGLIVLLLYPPPCSLSSSSTPTVEGQTQSSALLPAQARPYHSRPPRSAVTLDMSTPRRSSITACLSDNNTKCKCHGTKTCSHLVLIQMLKTTKAAHLQTVTCPHRSFHQWTMAHSISTRTINGRQTCPTSSTLCRHDIRQGPHGKQSRLGPLRYIHHKITGVPVALAGHTAQLPP